MSSGRRVPQAVDDALARWGGATSRRDFLKTSGLFVFGVSGVGAVGAGRWGFGREPVGDASPEPASYPDPDFLQLDSWLVVHEDGSATFYVGKTDGGQGTGTATQQMMCDELDIAFDQATVVMGRTDMTVDRAAPAARTRSSATPWSDAGSRRRPGACCWRWPRSASACPWRR